MQDQLDRIEKKLDKNTARTDAIFEKIGGRVPYAVFIPVVLSILGYIKYLT